MNGKDEITDEFSRISLLEKEEGQEWIQLLSVELMEMIFKSLEPFDLLNCRDVSSYWRELVNFSSVWKNLGFTHESLRAVPEFDLEKLIYYNKNALLCDHSDDSSHTFQAFLFASLSNALQEDRMQLVDWMQTCIQNQLFVNQFHLNLSSSSSSSSSSISTSTSSFYFPPPSNPSPKEQMIWQLREESMRHFERGEELNGKNVMCWMNHGFYSFQWKNFKYAKFAFRKISTEFSQEEAQVSYYYNVGYTHYRLNDDSKAIQNFKKSLELFPLKFPSNCKPPLIEFPLEYSQKRKIELETRKLNGEDLSCNQFTLNLLLSIPLDSSSDSLHSNDHSSHSSNSSKIGMRKGIHQNEKNLNGEKMKKGMELNQVGFFSEMGKNRRGKEFESPISLARCFNHIATSFQFLDRNEEAFEFYNKALCENYLLPNVHYGLAWLYNSNKNQEKARFHFEKAIELNPCHIHALTKLGWVYQESGDEEIARKFFTKSLELDSAYAPAQNGMADTFVYDIALLADNMRAKESIQKLMALLKKYPKYSNGYILLGTLYYTELELFGESLKAFEKAVELAPNKKLCYEIAKCHFMLGNYSEAMKELEEELKLIEECINHHVICHVNTNGSLKASHVRQLTKVHTLMGDLLLQENRLDEAKLHYQKAIELNPNYKVVYLGLAILHSRSKNFRTSSQCFEDAIQVNEYNYNDIVQWSANRKSGWNNNEKAVKLFEQIMKVSPLHIQTHREWAKMIQEEINEMTREEEGFQPPKEQILNPSYYRSQLSLSSLSSKGLATNSFDRVRDDFHQGSEHKSLIHLLIEERDSHIQRGEQLRSNLISWCTDLSKILFSINKIEEGEGWKDRAERISRTQNFYIPR